MVMGNEATVLEDSRKDWLVGPIPVQIEKEDFNRDGNLDLAILSVGTSGYLVEEYGRTLQVLQNDGDGGFPQPFVVAIRVAQPSSATPESVPHFAVGDFNDDGWPDLALLEPFPSEIRLAFNTTERMGAQVAFAASGRQLRTSSDARRVAAGDFNADGNDDLVVASGTDGIDGNGRVEILVSDGLGGLTAGGAVPVGSRPTCIVAALTDGDESLDVVLGGGVAGAGQACVIRGDGAGGFRDASCVPVSGVPSEIAVGDLDGAGLEDLVLSLPESGILSSILVTSGERSRGLFCRGDVNSDNEVDISDPISLLGYLFLGGEADCLEALDTNDDASVDVTDPIYLLEFLYTGGPSPPAPFPQVGEDPGEHTLGCER